MRDPNLRGSLITLALGALAACATEPQSRFLTGEFGGRLIGLVATDTAAHFQFPCARGVTGPLRVDSAGTAHATGVAADGFPPGLSWSLHIVTKVTGDSLNLSTTWTTTIRDSRRQ